MYICAQNAAEDVALTVMFVMTTMYMSYVDVNPLVMSTVELLLAVVVEISVIAELGEAQLGAAPEPPEVST
jgi:hypothetical protein